MIAETIISLIGPHFFLANVDIHEYVERYDAHITYKLNHILCSAVWLKCYGIIRTILLSNRYTSARGQRICNISSCDSGIKFSIQGIFKQMPMTVLTPAFILSIIFLSYILRIFETPLVESSGQPFDYF